MAGAIVIGRDYGALGVIRSLGRKGVPVWLLEEAPSNASVSRYLQRRRAWPADEHAQLALLESLADDEGLRDWTIIPASDEAAATIARHHDRLAARFRLTTPHWQVYRWAYDKRLTHDLAERAGVPVPQTAYPRDRADLLKTEWLFPVIIKPATKPETNALTAAKAWRVDDEQELLARYDEAASLIDSATIMVQELIPGGGEGQLSFSALCEDGRVLASITARRLRQFPIDFGKYSTHVESIVQADIGDISRRWIAEARYSGLIELEYKRDPRTGEPKLLDANGRVWAWHTLGARAGVDFSWLQYRHSRGERFATVTGRPGVRWVRALTDLPAAVRQVRAGMIRPRQIATAYRWPVEFAIWAWDDPLPAIADVPLMFWRSRSRRRVQPMPTEAGV